jgi:hypothetical protein
MRLFAHAKRTQVIAFRQLMLELADLFILGTQFGRLGISQNARPRC